MNSGHALNLAVASFGALAADLIPHIAETGIAALRCYRFQTTGRVLTLSYLLGAPENWPARAKRRAFLCSASPHTRQWSVAKTDIAGGAPPRCYSV
jgi:hypothetical protein